MRGSGRKEENNMACKPKGKAPSGKKMPMEDEKKGGKKLPPWLNKKSKKKGK
jgi:hypothetical protein